MAEKGKGYKSVIIKVKRYDPGKGFYDSEYNVKVSRYSTVLDALLSIIEKQDPTLAVRYSCRMGICGSCGMIINGVPRLACETNIVGLGVDKIYVEPMYNLKIVRDLVIDAGDFFKKHRSVKPYLIRKDEEEQFRAAEEYRQTPEQLENFLPFAYCIKCGLCVAACPVVAEKPGFLGPQALAQAYRWYADSRDQGGVSRLELVDSFDGVWSCEFAGSCSRVCPKGVDPAFAIQILKTEIFKKKLIKR
ncbi:MAG: succinate dehydrogenase iron-sulfur subunit [Sulfolobales archaeon]